jgi:serine/threonine protein kinase
MPPYLMTLAELAASNSGKVTDTVVANVTLCVLSTIKAFANRGLAHCDLKPQNLMLESSGVVVAIDFGSACPVGASIHSTTGMYDFAVAIEDYKASALFDLRFLGAMLVSLCIGTSKYLKAYEGYKEDEDSKNMMITVLGYMRESVVKSLVSACLKSSTVEEAWTECCAVVKTMPADNGRVDPKSVWPKDLEGGIA